MSSGFVTESEIAESRRKRQEEWDKVRTDDQPIEAPEEEYDPRPLFHRLEEQKQKKDAEYEENHKLKNMIRGLDDEEVGFLDMVERTKLTAARQISLEEKKEMKDFRERVSNLQEAAERDRLAQLTKPAIPKRAAPNVNSTRTLLQGVVVKKRKLSDNDLTGVNSESPHKNGIESTTPEPAVNGNHSLLERLPKIRESLDQGALRCIAVLPGLSSYTNESSDSDHSTDIEDTHTTCPSYDLLGRKQSKKEEEVKVDK